MKNNEYHIARRPLETKGLTIKRSPWEYTKKKESRKKKRFL